MNEKYTILLLVCWLSAAIFVAIALWAATRKTPMHFYSGIAIAPETISDIPAYNRENAKMWANFSMPFWLAGIFCLFEIPWGVLILLALSCTVGLWWLVKTYA